MTEVLLARKDEITSLIATASNTGSAGTGLFKQKTGTTLEFYKLDSATTALSIALSGTDKVNLSIANVVAGGASGLMTGADKTKLDGIAAGAAVVSVFGRAGVVVATAGDYTAAQITNVPAGGIAAVTVQAAINELDTEKAAASHTHVQADVTGLTTADSPQFAGLNIGHASDTTITRTGAGDIAVEGNALYRAGGTDVPVTDGGTGASTASGARTNLGLGTAAVQNTGTSGTNVPLLDGANTWSAAQTLPSNNFATDTDAGAAPTVFWTFYRNSASPANGDVIGDVLWQMKDAGGTARAGFRMRATMDTATAGAADVRMSWHTMQAGTEAVRIHLGLGLWSPNATGSDKGADSANFSAVYDDNVLLTDYVFDAYLGGKKKRYSARVKAAAKKLSARWFDPGHYAAYWKRYRRLPDMPDLNDCIDGAVKNISLGGMIQRLWMQVELLAIHNAQLLERIKRLER